MSGSWIVVPGAAHLVPGQVTASAATSEPAPTMAPLSTVAALDEEDVHEILTLRSGLGHMAIDLAMPVKDASRLRPCWEALEAMESSAAGEDRAQLVRSGYAFHASIFALAAIEDSTEYMPRSSSR